VEVLQLIAKGLTEDEVAHQTGRSYHSVHNHVRTIYKMYGVRSRGELLSRLKDGSPN
jgi:DNA-binding CsgD family transcriptional regulator